MHSDNQFDTEEFKVKFRAAFAVISFIAGMLFICFAVFSETAAASKYTGTVLGFISGTMITLILTYYFGSSDNQPPISTKVVDSTLKNQEEDE